MFVKPNEYIHADDYVGYKLKLLINKDQNEQLYKYFGVCRFVYNLGISIQEKYYKKCLEENNPYSLLSFFELNNEFTKLKNSDEYDWLLSYDSTTIKLVLKDVKNAYDRYFKHFTNHPKLKKKKYTSQSMPIRPERLTINKDSIRVPGLGKIMLISSTKDECIGTGNKGSENLPHKKYVNPRIVYDGCDYWLSFSMEKSEECNIEINSCKRFKNNEVWQNKEFTEPIGIDRGCKKNNWIVDSRGNTISKPNLRKEKKKIKKYSKKFTTKEKINDMKVLGKKTNSTIANDAKRVNRDYTKNEKKILKKLNKAYKKATNKKLDVIHNYVCSIIQEKPSCIVLEDLNTSDMLINKAEDVAYIHRKCHNKIVTESMIYTMGKIIERKAVNNGIPVMYADKEFPSSQLCSSCGYRQKIGLSRVYKCPCCGNVIDRDFNAALNLRNLAYPDYNQYELVV